MICHKPRNSIDSTLYARMKSKMGKKKKKRKWEQSECFPCLCFVTGKL